MHTSVISELTVFAGAAASGVLTAFLYDLFRLKRRIVKTAAIIVHIEDILFWLSAAIVAFLTSYTISDGETRFYFFAGLSTGGLAYFLLLSKIVLRLLAEVIRIVSWPFREVIRILSPVIRRMLIAFRRILGKGRNRLAIQAYRARVDIRRIKNAFTKK
jgi:spore cortex biosynthesis protein YabQ